MREEVNNKKSKLLIRITLLLIMVLAILGINNVSKASVTMSFDEMESSSDTYCIRNNYHFSGTVTFQNVHNYSVANGAWIDGGGNSLTYTETRSVVNGLKDNANKVAYILYIGGGYSSPSQDALWYLLRGYVSGSAAGSAGSNNDICKNATLYDTYVKGSGGSTYINKGYNGGEVDVRLTGQTGNIYHFVIDNIQLTDGDAIYGELRNLAASGGTILSQTYDPGVGTKFDYQPYSGTTSMVVTCGINNQYINASLQVCEHQGLYTYTSGATAPWQPIMIGNGNTTIKILTKTFNLTSATTSLTLHKTDQATGNPVPAGLGFRITVTDFWSATPSTVYNLQTDASGNIYIPNIVDTTTTIPVPAFAYKNITIEETNSTSAYIPLSTAITFILRYDYTNHIWQVYGSIVGPMEVAWSVTSTPSGDVTVTLANIPNTVINPPSNLWKYDAQNNSVAVDGAVFDITGGDGIDSISKKSSQWKYDISWNTNNWTVDSTSSGSWSSGTTSQSRTVTHTGHQVGTITIEETEAPVGYKIIKGKIKIEVQRYGTQTASQSRSRSQTGTDAAGNPIYGSWSTGSVGTYGDWGDFYDYSITSQTKDSTVLDAEFNKDAEIPDSDTNELILKIYDIPIIKLGGQVWNDQDTIDKDGQLANDLMDNDEPKVKGVKVQIYKVATGSILTNINGGSIYSGTPDSSGGYQVLTDIYGNSLTSIQTDENGQYVICDKTGARPWESCGMENGGDYYIKFTYDGVNYIAAARGSITDPLASHVTEIGRSSFNSNFRTISGTGYKQDNGSSNSYAGQLNYTYMPTNPTPTQDFNGTQEASVLNTIIKGGAATYPYINGSYLDMGDSVDPKYQMTAKTGNYLPNTSLWQNTWTTEDYMHINMGLYKREVDLSISKDVYKATVTIDGHPTVYNYRDLIENPDGTLKLPEDLGNTTGSSTGRYNLIVYESDYNYRVNAYTQNIINQLNPTSQPMTGEELEVYVTYAIIINNQPPGYANVKVNNIVDYFDPTYSYVSRQCNL